MSALSSRPLLLLPLLLFSSCSRWPAGSSLLSSRQLSATEHQRQRERRFSRRVDSSSSSTSNNGVILRSEEAAVLSAAALLYLNGAGVLDLDALLTDRSLRTALVGIPAVAILHAAAGAAEQAWAANAAIGCCESEKEGWYSGASGRGGVAVRASSFLGEGQRGAFATRPLAAGTFLAEYRGEALSINEYIRRYHRGGQQQQPNFVWRVHDDCFLDASDQARSNWCRFVNHAPTAARAAAFSEEEEEEKGEEEEEEKERERERERERGSCQARINTK